MQNYLLRIFNDGHKKKKNNITKVLASSSFAILSLRQNILQSRIFRHWHWMMAKLPKWPQHRSCRPEKLGTGTIQILLKNRCALSATPISSGVVKPPDCPQLLTRSISISLRCALMRSRRQLDCCSCWPLALNYYSVKFIWRVQLQKLVPLRKQKIGLTLESERSFTYMRQVQFYCKSCESVYRRCVSFQVYDFKAREACESWYWLAASLLVENCLRNCTEISFQRII